MNINLLSHFKYVTNKSTALCTLYGTYCVSMEKTSYFAVVCDPPCENGACVTTNNCLCTEGYIGDTCSTPGI